MFTRFFLCSIGLAIAAGAAQADLYRLESRLGLGLSLATDLPGGDDFGYGLHGDYTVGLYSWSTQIYAQTDYSVDIFHTNTRGLNWSLIVTKDFGAVKAGGFVGALMLEDQNIQFSAGATAMAQFGNGVTAQAEIGALTDGEDGAFFADNAYFGQIRLDYAINDTFGVYAKYGAISYEGLEQARGLVGVTYDDASSPWEMTGGVGVFNNDGSYSPLISTELRYVFGGDPLPQTPTSLVATPFDKFEFFDFNIQ